ncbi:hypothetical protein PR048_004235, partial [Dryococelus australis]
MHPLNTEGSNTSVEELQEEIIKIAKNCLVTQGNCYELKHPTTREIVGRFNLTALRAYDKPLTTVRVTRGLAIMEIPCEDTRTSTGLREPSKETELGQTHQRRGVATNLYRVSHQLCDKRREDVPCKISVRKCLSTNAKKPLLKAVNPCEDGEDGREVVGLNVSSTARSLEAAQVAQGRGTGEGMGRNQPWDLLGTCSSILLEGFRARSCDVTAPSHCACRLTAAPGACYFSLLPVVPRSTNAAKCLRVVPTVVAIRPIRVDSVSSKGYISTCFQTAANHRKRFAKWVAFCKRENFSPGESATSCSAHFVLTDYDETQRLKMNSLPEEKLQGPKLKPGAIPTVTAIEKSLGE